MHVLTSQSNRKSQKQKFFQSMNKEIQSWPWWSFKVNKEHSMTFLAKWSNFKQNVQKYWVCYRIQKMWGQIRSNLTSKVTWGRISWSFYDLYCSPTISFLEVNSYVGVTWLIDERLSGTDLQGHWTLPKFHSGLNNWRNKLRAVTSRVLPVKIK